MGTSEIRLKTTSGIMYENRLNFYLCPIFAKGTFLVHVYVYFHVHQDEHEHETRTSRCHDYCINMIMNKNLNLNMKPIWKKKCSYIYRILDCLVIGWSDIGIDIGIRVL
jgi:hypothetical protein